jgi:hypothetical protein
MAYLDRGWVWAGRTVSAIAFASLAAAGCSGGGADDSVTVIPGTDAGPGGGDAGRAGATGSDGGAPPSDAGHPSPTDGGGPDRTGPTGTPPSVTKLDVDAPDEDGAVALELTVSGGRGGPLVASVAVSRGGGSFAPATLAGQAPGTTAGLVIATWRPLADVGFRPDSTVILQVSVSDAVGAGPAATFPVPAFANRHGAARHVDHYLANYGSWTAADVMTAQRYQLVIAHPGQGNLTRAAVAGLQVGQNMNDPRDDVLVLCYISVGEDLRTNGFSDDQIRADPRFRGDGTGPRIDPRGWMASGTSLAGIDPKGLPSTGGTGFASYYVDDNDVLDSANHVGNGFPDRNQIFGGLFVNAGDPNWFDIVDGMTLDGTDRHAGLRELLTPSYGRGLDCDGVFLDTIDTAAPNSYTNASSANQSSYEWTAPGFGSFIRHVHEAYPDRVVLQNRGLFFFDPRRPQYAYNARGAIDFVLFESFRLNSDTTELWDPIHYPDNRYNVAPKLMAEANRPDGFKVLSLGYAAGPADQMSSLTLVGQSTVGLDDLMEDIQVTQDLQGFRHYLTDAAVSLVNDFVLTHASLDDHDPPWWTSTYNDHFVSPAVAATPRVGIQQAVGGGGQVTVRWDVALDKTGVRYALYAQPTPFDFTGDPKLAKSRRIPLVPSVPQAYLGGVGPGRFPYEATVADFPAGQLQYLVIRATDGATPSNEETNTVVLTATP